MTVLVPPYPGDRMATAWQPPAIAVLAVLRPRARPPAALSLGKGPGAGDCAADCVVGKAISEGYEVTIKSLAAMTQRFEKKTVSLCR